MSLDNALGRRRLLKSGVPIAISTLIGGFGYFGVQRANASSPQDTWEKSDSETYTQAGAQTGIYHSCSVGWYGATYEEEAGGTWGHDFRVTSTTSSRHTENTSELERINSHYCGFRHGTLERFALFTSDEFHGVWPREKTDDYDHTDFALDLAEKAITTLSTYADFALTASGFAGKLIPDDAKVSSDDFDDLNKWNYSNEKTDVGHFRHFEAYTGESESTFSVKTGVAESVYSLTPSTKFIFNIKEGWKPTEGKFQSYSDNSITTSSNTKIIRPKKGWTVERIPREQIFSRGKELNIPNPKLAKHSKRDGPLYYAHNAPISLIG